MKKKRKVHYASGFIINVACGMAFHYPVTITNDRFLKTTFNKRKVTCKQCRKTKIYKSKKSYGK